jgi:hypothetical protein
MMDTLRFPRPLAAFALAFSLLAPAGAQDEKALPPRREPAHLGVQVELKDPADKKSGVVVIYVMPGSSAQEMGFQVGDEIRSINDVLVTDPETFIGEIRRQNAGSKQRFRLGRGGQELKVEGRLKSQEKGLHEYQEILRKTFLGQPLPEPPGIVWWDPAKKAFVERRDGLSSLRGKHVVLFSFDECAECKREKFDKLSLASAALSSVTPPPPVVVVGIFTQRDPVAKDKVIEAGTRYLTTNPPSIPIAAAYYSGKPGPADREQQVLLQNRGVVLLDDRGLVRFLQVTGQLEADFGNAFQGLLRQLGAVPPGAPAPGKKDAPN